MTMDELINGVRAFEMNICLMVLPKTGDGYGVLRQHYICLAKEFESTHLVKLREIDDPNLLSDLMIFGSDKSNIIIYGWFGYDFQLSCQNLGGIYKIANLLKAKQIAYIDDHPFLEFMIPRLLGASNKIKYICVDIFLKKQLVELYGVNPENIYYHVYPTRLTFPILEKVEKEIDILIPLSPTNYFQFDDFKKKYLSQEPLRLIYETMNSVLINSYSSFDVFLEFSNALLKHFNTHISKLPIEARNTLLAFLHEYDYFIRADERNKAIRRILDIPDINVEITQIPISIPKSSIRANVKEFGLLSFQEIVTKTKHSKFLLNVCPTYPTQIHERVLFAMEMGCGVITNLNIALTKYQDVLYDVYAPDLSKIIMDPAMLERNVKRGREIAKTFNYKSFKDFIVGL